MQEKKDIIADQLAIREVGRILDYYLADDNDAVTCEAAPEVYRALMDGATSIDVDDIAAIQAGDFNTLVRAVRLASHDVRCEKLVDFG